jgi:hypothetical protein
MLKEASKGASTSPILVTPTSSSFPAIKTPENKENDPDEPNSEDEGDIQTEYTSY